MRLIKILALTLTATAASAAAVVCVLLFSASLQTKIFNSISPKLNVGRASVSISGASVNGLKFGEVFYAQKIELKYSLWDALSRNIKIDSLKITGAKILAKKDGGQSGGIEAAHAETGGAQKTAADAAQTAEPAAGETKKFEFPWTVEVVSAEGDLTADGKRFEFLAKNIFIERNLKPKSASLRVATDGAEFKAALETLGGTRSLKALLASGDKKILQLSASSPLDFSKVEAEARIDADDALTSAFVPQSVKLPKFSVALYAKCGADSDGSNASVKIVGDSKFSGLGEIYEPLKILGECGADVSIDATKAGDKISVQKFEANFSESSSPILGVSAVPFSASSREELEKAEIVAVLSVPPRILNSLLSGMEISSDNLSGKVSIRRRGDSFEISTLSPFLLTNANLSKAGEPIVKNLNLLADAKASVGEKSNVSLTLTAADSNASKLSLSVAAAYAGGAADVKFKADGDLNPVITRIYSISSMSSLGLKLSAESSIKYAENKVEIDSLSGSVLDSTGNKAVEFSALSKLFYDLKGGSLTSESPKLARLDAPNFPFAIIKPFAPEIDAGKTSAKIEISSPRKGMYEFSANMSAESISYKNGGEYALRGVSFSADAAGSFDGKTAAVKISKGIVGEGGTPLGTFDAEASYDSAAKKLTSAKINATATLPPIFNQPALLKYSNISKGTADVSASYSKDLIGVDLSVHSLATRTAQNTVDLLTAKISSDLKNTSAKFTIKSTAGETNASANLKTDAEISLSLEAPSVVVDDILLLSGAFSNPNYTKESAKPAEDGKSQRIIKPSLAVLEDEKRQKADSIAKKDAKAFWYFGKDMALSVDAGNVVFKGSTMLEKFAAAASATASELKLSKFSGKFLGAEFGGASNITFDPAREIPYEMGETKFKLTGFEVSEIFADKSAPPMTGRFNAEFSVRGSGNNAQHLFEYLVGSGTIASDGGGYIRILDKNSVIGKSASIAGNVISFAGRLLNNKVKELSGAGELVRLLAQMNYTSAVMKLSRGSDDYDYNIDLAEMRTESFIFLSKSGRIAFDPSVSFNEQKLDIPISLYMAASMRSLFEGLGFGETKSEIEGYYTGPKFNVSGTVSRPSNDLLESLSETKKAVGNVLDSINIFKRK